MIFFFVVLLPIYPVFGAVIYDGSNRGALGVDINETSIINEYTDVTDTDFIEPEIPSTDTQRSTVEEYIVQSGDTLGEVAEQFAVGVNTLRWANNLSTDTLRVGQKLIVPPGDGIMYTTKKGDTLDAISIKFKTTSNKIRTANFLGDVLPTGVTLFLPDAQRPSISIETTGGGSEDVSGTFTLKLINKGGAGFVPGHCTYFVAQYWPVKWRGNARNWYKNANSAGYKTGQVAKPGSIVVWYGPGYNLTYGHVGIVMSVNTKAGTMVVKDMNYAGLWKVTTRVEKIKNKNIVGFIYNEKK
ncbi:LysM peptidoglycan-binding domain-containing protein [Candidatus Gracilibacteria bacterium]|nr:LysM peptidoglycan-binding domain-containing protein [Candidatus Gracilibacteria bacterium]